jgi:hypothetical protein
MERGAFFSTDGVLRLMLCSEASRRADGVSFRMFESIRGVIVITQPRRTRLVADVTVSSWLRLLQLEMAEMREFQQTARAHPGMVRGSAGEAALFNSLVVMANYFGGDSANCHLEEIELSGVN